MRSSAVCWLSVLAASTAFAEAPAGVGLDELLERMASTSGVEAHFHEVKELALLAVPLESRGIIYFVPPDRFARFTTSPGSSALVVDGRALRFREGRGGEEMDLSGSPLARAFVDNFVVLWSGDREKLERLYQVELRSRGTEWEMELTPRGGRLASFVDTIVLRGDDGGMREMIVRERDGDRTRTRLVDVRIDADFSPDELRRIFSADPALAEPARER